MPDASQSYIREIAVKPDSPNQAVFGGFDQKLNFVDLSRPDAPYIQRLNLQGVIGNVKWAPFHNASYTSCGLDDGKFFIFDTRSKIKDAAFFVDTRKEDLYTHERYNEFGVLLGYGDGEFKHIDMRIANKVSVLTALLSNNQAQMHDAHLCVIACVCCLSCSIHHVQDPFVEAIGAIEFNAEAQAFVVSGYTDFTVWKVDGSNPHVHSHSVSGTGQKHADGYSCTAVWYDAKTVLSSDNVGGVSLFLQDFE